MSAFANRNTDGTATDVWLTPPKIIQVLGPFDLDPCACSEPRPWPTARNHFTAEDNGLVKPWFGVVWCNPPYREADKFLARMAEHKNGIALVFARTETKWFQRYVFGGADYVLFLAGRLSFYRPDGTRGDKNAGAPSCLIGYGDVGSRLNRAVVQGRLKGKTIIL